MPQLIIYILVLAACAQASAKKVAILIHGGDQKALRITMQQLLSDAERAYRHFGFEVQVLGGPKSPKINAAQFDKTISSLRDVTDLRIDFIGHGGVSQLSGSSEGHVPYRLNAASELHQSYKKMMKMDSPSFVSVDLNTYDIGKIQLFYPELVKKTQLETAIGVGHIRKALRVFHDNNKNSPVSISLLNCYSGMVAEQLSDVKNVAVYSNSPALEPAIALVKHVPANERGQYYVESKSGLGEYYRRSFFQDPPVSIEEAWTEANEKMVALLAPSGASWQTGRSAQANYISNWCRTRKTESRENSTIEYEAADKIRKTLLSKKAKIEKFLKSEDFEVERQNYLQCTGHYRSLDEQLRRSKNKLVEQFQNKKMPLQDFISDVLRNFIKNAQKDRSEIAGLVQSELKNMLGKQRKNALNNNASSYNLVAIDKFVKRLEVSPKIFWNDLEVFVRRSIKICKSKIISRDCSESLSLLSKIVYSVRDHKSFDISCVEKQRPLGKQPSCRFSKVKKSSFCKKQWDRIPKNQLEKWINYIDALYSEKRSWCLEKNAPVFVAASLDSFSRKLKAKTDCTKRCEMGAAPTAERSLLSIQSELSCLSRFEREATQVDWQRIEEIERLGQVPARGN